MDDLTILLALHAPLRARDLPREMLDLGPGSGLVLTTTRNQADTWAALRRLQPDAVLLVPCQPQPGSTELASLLRPPAGASPPALLVLTDQPAYLESHAEVIDDFLSPGDPAELIARRLHFAVARLRSRTKLREEREHLLLASSTDYKTGLANDRQFAEMCRIECARAVRENHALGVLMIDLDNFKDVNDDHDHEFGDLALRKVADTLRDGLRPFDTPARKGGDEFAVLLPNATLSSVRTIAERLRANVEALQLEDRGHSTGITVTIGVAAWHPDDSESFDEALLGADQALLAAKDAGRNQVAVHGEIAVPPPRRKTATKSTSSKSAAKTARRKAAKKAIKKGGRVKAAGKKTGEASKGDES